MSVSSANVEQESKISSVIGDRERCLEAGMVSVSGPFFLASY